MGPTGGNGGCAAVEASHHPPCPPLPQLLFSKAGVPVEHYGVLLCNNNNPSERLAASSTLPH